MAIDFFEATKQPVRQLNKAERELYDYVVKNMNEVKNMSIQKFAAGRFVSTTTIFRFAKKLGFSGYADFIDSLLVTTHSKEEFSMPSLITKENYSENYLSNAIESVRVMSDESVQIILEKLALKPNIYILTDDNTISIAKYAERLFIGLKLNAYAPEASYQMQNLENHINENDLLIALSYSGHDEQMNAFIQRVFLKHRPFLVSITKANNNILESLSDINFYVFAEKIRMNNMDLTSSISMMMILELLVYSYSASLV
ncbi:MAG: MurR/RpiR family transcriptional regulator [Streptococcaceae bacterium]|nr:MurR/RpiR family transcriptional regulator [Streptococcaceae bacterium]